MFTRAIVKRPCRNMINGLRKDKSLVPDYKTAMKQHDAYISVLEKCGLMVDILDESPEFPDSTFIEDTAVLTPCCAVITNPGTESRKEEAKEAKKALSKYYNSIYSIHDPGTLDGGDIMITRDRCYIGLSCRTNHEGALQLKQILEKYSIESFFVPVKKSLHLKTSVNFLDHNTLVLTAEFMDNPLFSKYRKILIDENESYAANSLSINGKVIVPAGFLSTLDRINHAGYKTLVADVSEYRKLDGGLSCLSLRF